jgi:putative transposase
MYLPGYAYHLVQRGNNREACFFEEENYRVYLRYLGEGLLRYRARLHAYCLMTNHVHFLLTPEQKGGISTLMQVVCSRYAQYINKKYSRTGTLWSGRHKASAIDTENYLLKCYRYIELNPVTARIVNTPEDYAWTSHHHNAWSVRDPLISTHELYRALGQNREQRCSSYRGLFRSPLSGVDYDAIRKAAHFSMPLGSNKFIDEIERKIGRPVGFAQRGRPYSKLVKN